MGRYFESDFMHFHRIEPTIATRHWLGDKTLFVHNDIQKQMNPKLVKRDSLAAFPGSIFRPRAFNQPVYRNYIVQYCISRTLPPALSNDRQPRHLPQKYSR
jgi:hypothetical protein